MVWPEQQRWYTDCTSTGRWEKADRGEGDATYACGTGDSWIIKRRRHLQLDQTRAPASPRLRRLLGTSNHEHRKRKDKADLVPWNAIWSRLAPPAPTRPLGPRKPTGRIRGLYASPDRSLNGVHSPPLCGRSAAVLVAGHSDMPLSWTIFRLPLQACHKTCTFVLDAQHRRLIESCFC